MPELDPHDWPEAAAITAASHARSRALRRVLKAQGRKVALAEAVGAVQAAATVIGEVCGPDVLARILGRFVRTARAQAEAPPLTKRELPQ